MKTTKELEDLLLSTGIVTDEMKTKLCIIEDIGKFTTMKDIPPPSVKEMKSLMNIPLKGLEDIHNDMNKWWNGYLEFKKELASTIQLLQLLTLMKTRGK